MNSISKSTRQTLSLIVLAVALSIGAFAQGKSKSNDKIIFKGKVYVVDAELLDMEQTGNIRITVITVGKGEDQESSHLLKKYGIFREELERNENFKIYISKDGYETKFFEFSTMGAKPSSKYSFYADIGLKKEGEANDYDEESATTHIGYDKQKDGFILLD